VPEFDDDTALEKRGDRWYGSVTDRWDIGPGRPNGGYVASFLIRALAAEAPQPDPLTMTTHYLGRPTTDTEISVAVDLVHAARSHAFLQARMEQAGRPLATALAAFGSRDRESPSFSVPMPETPPPEQLEDPPRMAMPGMSFRDRFDWRPPPSMHPGSWGSFDNEALSGGWQRFSDGRPVDELTIPLFMDAYAPAIFARTRPEGGVPTIELTVHWRGRPSGTWQFAEFRTRILAHGYLEEDGLLWSADGTLVAQSRQLALFVG
jgi:acyl-CoA thioesterase